MKTYDLMDALADLESACELLEELRLLASQDQQAVIDDLLARVEGEEE